MQAVGDSKFVTLHDGSAEDATQQMIAFIRAADSNFRVCRGRERERESVCVCVCLFVHVYVCVMEMHRHRSCVSLLPPPHLQTRFSLAVGCAPQANDFGANLTSLGVAVTETLVYESAAQDPYEAVRHFWGGMLCVCVCMREGL